MRIYFGFAMLLLAVHIFNCIYGKRIGRDLHAVVYWAFAGAMVLFAGTRVNLGIDYRSYYSIYYTVQHYITGGYATSDFVLRAPVWLRQEPLYLYLNALCRSFEQLLLVIAVLGVGIKCYVIFKHTSYRFFWLFIYFGEFFLYFDMGVIRQGVAMALMMLAIFALNENRTRMFLFYIIIGTGFHYSAVTLLPVYFIYKWKIRYKSLLYFLVPASIMLIVDLKEYWINLASIFLGNKIFAVDVGQKMMGYMGDFSGQWGGIIRISLIFGLAMYAYKLLQLEMNGDLFVMTYLYGMILMFLFYNTMPILAGRGLKFYYLMQVFIFDNVFQNGIKKRISWAILLFLTALNFWHIYLTLPGSVGNDFQSYLPYRSYIFSQ